MASLGGREAQAVMQRAQIVGLKISANNAMAAHAMQEARRLYNVKLSVAGGDVGLHARLADFEDIAIEASKDLLRSAFDAWRFGR